jgi:hypothetical protein
MRIYCVLLVHAQCPRRAGHRDVWGMGTTAAVPTRVCSVGTRLFCFRAHDERNKGVIGCLRAIVWPIPHLLVHLARVLVVLLAPFSCFLSCRCPPPSRTAPSSRSPLPSRCRLAQCLAGTFSESAEDEAVLAIKARARGSRLGLPPSLFAFPSTIALVRTSL